MLIEWLSPKLRNLMRIVAIPSILAFELTPVYLIAVTFLLIKIVALGSPEFVYHEQVVFIVLVN